MTADVSVDISAEDISVEITDQVGRIVLSAGPLDVRMTFEQLRSVYDAIRPWFDKECP